MSGAAPLVRVKICGVTNPADAEAAIECGADALGFNFYPGSKRYIQLEAASAWMSELPRDIIRVAVLVNPTWEEAIRLGEHPSITGLQLHGSEKPDFCLNLRRRGIRFAKALSVVDAFSLRNLPPYSTKTFVIDSAGAGVFGGSGTIFPWSIARDFVRKQIGYRVVLAGGLTPANITEAIRIVRPFGVDVTSGVEAAPGRKDHHRLREFIAAAKSA